MSVTKRIKKASLSILGCEAEPWDNVWTRIKELSEIYGQDAVVDAFENWAKSRPDLATPRPVGEFLKVSLAVLRGASLQANPALSPLVKEMAYMTDNNVVFDREKQAGLGKLLVEYSPEEIKLAFAEFYGKIEGDNYLVRNAAKTFVESAEQLLYTQRKRKEDARKQQGLISQTIVQEQKKAENERLERQRADEAEKAFIEEELPR